jgi:predicted RNase H-like HicB family nuclease
MLTQGLASENSQVDLRPSGIEGTALMPGYIALVHKDEGTSYGVSFPDVPGCISAGDTFEEAVANASEALAGHLALMKSDGDPLPVPRTFEQLKRDPEFLEDSADAIVTVVTPQRLPAEAQSS